MKANNGIGNIPKRDEWETPTELFNQLDKQYNFKFDCCATKKNRKCKAYTNNFNLSYIIKCIAWMNPPFSKAYEMFCSFFQNVNQGIAIYRCDNMETKVWQKVIFPNATWIFIPNKRIKYEGMNGKGSRFPSALIGFNVEEVKKLNGFTMIPKQKHEGK